jgi:hypothetical protein
LNNKLFGILLVVVITLYKAYQQGKLKLLKKGILALIVAIIAQLDLTIAPFWIVFTLAVSFEGYV